MLNVWILLAYLIALFLDVLCQCFSAFLCCVLLLFVNAWSFVCSISVHCVLLLPFNILLMCFISVCQHHYYVLLVLVGIPLLCAIDVHQCSLVGICWCLSSPLCCILLVFVVTPLMHFIGVH